MVSWPLWRDHPIFMPQKISLCPTKSPTGESKPLPAPATPSRTTAWEGPGDRATRPFRPARFPGLSRAGPGFATMSGRGRRDAGPGADLPRPTVSETPRGFPATRGPATFSRRPTPRASSTRPPPTGARWRFRLQVPEHRGSPAEPKPSVRQGSGAAAPIPSTEFRKPHSERGYPAYPMIRALRKPRARHERRARRKAAVSMSMAPPRNLEAGQSPPARSLRECGSQEPPPRWPVHRSLALAGRSAPNPGCHPREADRRQGRPPGESPVGHPRAGGGFPV